MCSHMTTLGFPVTTEQDFRHYVYQASEFGRKIETSKGSYTLWAPGDGIELWVQTNLHRRIIGMNPHFRGRARMRIGLTRYVVRHRHTLLDGALYGWANPASTDAYPLVFDLPDADTYNKLDLPYLADVQLAAFAQSIKGFATAETYLAAYGGDNGSAVETFIPSGLFTAPGKKKEPPQSHANFSGRVLATKLLTNPVTGQKFYWAMIHTVGGKIDVVADPQVVEGRIVTGGVVQGTFCLSGRLV